MLTLEKQIANLKMEYEYQNSAVKEKESVISEYTRMIDESEKAYTKVNYSIAIKCLKFLLAR